MGQDEGDHHEPDEWEEEYPLSEPGASLADYEPSIYPRRDRASGDVAEEDQPGDKPFQFTLADLFWLITGVAILLGLLGCVPGGFSAEALAGMAGVGLLVSLFVLAIVQPSRPIIRLAWWVMLGFYVLASLVAVVRSML